MLSTGNSKHDVDAISWQRTLKYTPCESCVKVIHLDLTLMSGSVALQPLFSFRQYWYVIDMGCVLSAQKIRSLSQPQHKRNDGKAIRCMLETQKLDDKCSGFRETPDMPTRLSCSYGFFAQTIPSFDADLKSGAEILRVCRSLFAALTLQIWTLYFYPKSKKKKRISKT